MGLFPMNDPLPLLPVLTWHESEQQFGSMYPNSREYLSHHAHWHDACRHATRCPFPSDLAPCQAYEIHEAKCPNCAFGFQVLGSWCADWVFRPGGRRNFLTR